ncbi:vacuolar fusion protein MON1 [Melampsora americana]|nr:vacuolar fusion protein MON1 [Melampsora americana]
MTLPILDARKYYILTSAGKPVWSTEEDCDDKEGGDTTGLMGLMQAVISIFEDDGDELRYIDASSVKIAVMLKAPLYLLVVSNWGEPESILRLHLEYLHLLIQSILSLRQLHQMFERRENYDLRRTLSGTESIFRGMVNRLQWDFSIMMSCLEVFNCNPKIRDRIGRIVTPIGTPNGLNQKIKSVKRKADDERVAMDEEEEDDLDLETVARKLLYSIVLVNGKVACLVRPKLHSVHPSDLHLIITTVLSSYSLQTSESWIPICLPGYNSTGFLHAYLKFLPEPKSSIGIIFVSGDRNGFFKLKKWLEKIESQEIWNEIITEEGKKEGKKENLGNYSLEQIGIPGLRHFVFKHKALVQVSLPIWEDDYLPLEDRRRLVTTYQKAYDLIHPKLSKIKDDKRPPITFIYLRNEAEAIIGWNTSTHELYMTVSPMLSKTAVISVAHSVVKWVRQEKVHYF